MMPPATPAKRNTLIFDVLALSAVEGEWHEGLSRQCEALRVGFKGGSRFVKFTRGGSGKGRRAESSEWDFASAIRAIGEQERSLRKGRLAAAALRSRRQKKRGAA